MRITSFLACACCAVLFSSCSDEAGEPRTRVIEAAQAPASKPVPAKAPLDRAIEDAIRAELKAQVAKLAAADPNWSTYPTITDDSPRAEGKEDVPADQVHVYLRGAGVNVPVQFLKDCAISILPEKVELRLEYPTMTVTLADATPSTRDAAAVPDAWVAAAAPEIPEARWTELESRVASALGDGGPGPQAVKERIAAYRQQAPRWKEGCAREFGTKMKFLKGALWASDDFVDRFDIGHAYCAARLMMAKPAVVASIPGPTDVPIAPVLGGPVLGLRRGRAGVNREVHGVITGADGLWVELHMTSADSKPIAEPEAFVSGFFDTMRPFEHRPSDAAAVSQKLKLAQKESDPAARRKAALLSLASFHLDPKAKRAEHFVTAWAKKEPAPTQAELQTLVDQIATWIKAGPRARKELEDVIPKPK